MSEIQFSDVFDYLKIKQKDRSLEAEDFLGFYHENDADTIAITYLEQRGCMLLGKSLAQIQALGPELLAECMHPNDIEPSINTLFHYKSQKTSKPFSYFQRIKLHGKDDYDLFITCASYNQERNVFECVTSSVTQMIEFESVVNAKMDKQAYTEKYLSTYEKLTDREKEVLRYTSLGKSSKDIAELLFLSPQTIETHRKNIRKKTNITSNSELIQFSLNFKIL